VDRPLVLDQLVQAWGDSYDIGHDGQAWWYRRRDGAGSTHTASSPGEMHKLIADDHAFFPVRRAS
jgi:hypothetical protein